MSQAFCTAVNVLTSTCSSTHAGVKPCQAHLWPLCLNNIIKWTFSTFFVCLFLFFSLGRRLTALLYAFDGVDFKQSSKTEPTGSSPVNCLLRRSSLILISLQFFIQLSGKPPIKPYKSTQKRANAELKRRTNVDVLKERCVDMEDKNEPTRLFSHASDTGCPCPPPTAVSMEAESLRLVMLRVRGQSNDNNNNKNPSSFNSRAFAPRFYCQLQVQAGLRNLE